MKILNERNQLEVLDHLLCNVVGETFWVLDLGIMDFTLTPLLMLEEQRCSAVQTIIGTEHVTIPSSWKVMIYDSDTSELDVIDIKDVAGRDFTAFGYGPMRAIPKPLPIKVVGHVDDFTFVVPSKHKQQMWCLPIDDTTWIVCCDSDAHVKYLKDASIGDIIQ